MRSNFIILLISATVLIVYELPVLPPQRVVGLAAQPCQPGHDAAAESLLDRFIAQYVRLSFHQGLFILANWFLNHSTQFTPIKLLFMVMAVLSGGWGWILENLLKGRCDDQVFYLIKVEGKSYFEKRTEFFQASFSILYGFSFQEHFYEYPFDHKYF